MPHVVCLGHLMTDVVAQLPGALAFGSDTPAPISFRGGGAAANVAAWLVAAGTQATFVGRVGDDVAGRAAVEDLGASGVRTAVTVDQDAPTGACIVLVDPGGERTMIPHVGANALMGDVQVPADLGDLLYVSGYALLAPGSRGFALEAIAAARRVETPVAVDAASAAPLAEAGAGSLRSWLGHGIVLFANDDEAQVLCGRGGADAAGILARRFGEAIVKRGPGGAFWSDGESTVLGRAVEVSEVLDTTGAGDAFAAGFLHGRLAGHAVAQCLDGAGRLAARAVRCAGARPARDTIE